MKRNFAILWRQELIKGMGVIIFLSSILFSGYGSAQINEVEEFESSDLGGWSLDSIDTFWWPAQTNYSIIGKSLQLCYQNEYGIIRGGYNSDYLLEGEIQELSAQRVYSVPSQTTNMKLRFLWRCNGEQQSDYGTVFCKGENTAWYEIMSNVRSDDPYRVNQAEIALPSCMDKETSITVMFRFRFDSSFDFLPGFVIDNLELRGAVCAQAPAPPTSIGNFQFCFSDELKVELTANSPTGKLAWYLSDQCSAPIVEASSAFFLPLQDQIYYVKTLSPEGCVSDEFLPIIMNVIQLPEVTVLAQSNTVYGNDAFIEVSAIGETTILSYLWYGPDDFSSSEDLIVNVNEGIYELVVTDGYGCQAYQRFYLSEGSELLIPKLITPNGDDLNDIWKIKGIEQWHDLDLYIFDQSEALIYHQKVFPTEKFIPWNGRDGHGNLVKPGDYFFVFISEEKARKEKGVISVVYE